MAGRADNWHDGALQSRQSSGRGPEGGPDERRAVEGTPPSVTLGNSIAGRRRRRRWVKILLLGLLLISVAGVVAGQELGASYQPVAFGDAGGGLTGNIVSRHVNNFAPMEGQIYVPPQKAASGAYYVSLTNTGPYPVTIESATLNNPDNAAAPFLQAEPLRDSGHASYWPLAGQAGIGHGKLLAGTVLHPAQYIVIRLPVTTAGCWMTSGGYSVQSSFWVRFKFLFWTHLVQISWTVPYDQSEGAIIAHEPEPASQGGLCPR
jgi:hypothetical protein